MITKNSVIRVRAEVAFRKLEDGSVTIVSPATDTILTINRAAAEIWEMIDGTNCMKHITDRFIFLHGNDSGAPSVTEIENEVTEIINSFFEKSLLEEINN